MNSKIPKCTQTKKPAKCKFDNIIQSKSKYPSAIEDKRVTENVSNSLTAGNTKNVLTTSKVPIRSESRTCVQSKSSAITIVNKSSSKNKCLMNNNRVVKKLCYNGSIPSKEDNSDSHLPKKNSCFIKTNSLSHCNTIMNSFVPQSSVKDEKNLHAKHTIQPKRIIQSKGILKENLRNNGDLSIPHSPEGDLNLDSKVKNSQKDRISKSRKVTFKSLSSNDLSKISEDNANLIDGIDMNKALTVYQIDKNSSVPKENIKAEDEQMSHDFNEGNDSNEPKRLSIISTDIVNDKPMMTLQNLSCENIQRENMELRDSSLLDTLIKTEASNSEEVRNVSKNLYPSEEKCDFLPEVATIKKDLLRGNETPNGKQLGRRQLIQKQIDEKIEILTAEFLKYIKEKKRRNPRPVISKKSKPKNVSWEGNISQELWSRNEPSLQVTTNMKDNNVRNDKIQDRENLSYNLPKSREDKILLTEFEQGLLDSHPLTKGDLDIIKSPVSSRIPRAMSSKKESSSPIVSFNLKSDNNIHEKRKVFSPSISQKVRKTEKNEMKYSSIQNLCEGETDKVDLLNKEFDIIRNVCKRDFHEEVRLDNNKIAHQQGKFKNNSDSKNLLAGENIKNSHHSHETENHKDRDIGKKLNSGTKLTKEETKCITKFKNHNGERQETPEENFCHIPSNNIISLEGDKENRPKTYLLFENKTHSSYSSGEESGKENILLYEDKENIKYYSSVKLLFSQHKKKIFCFTLIFVFSALLFISVFQ